MYYDAYTLAVMDNGEKKFFSCDNGWTKDKNEACWFETSQDAENQAFDEGLAEGESIIEGVNFEGEEI